MPHHPTHPVYSSIRSKTFALSILYHCESHSNHTHKKNGIITVLLKLILNSMYVAILWTIWNMRYTLTLFDIEHIESIKRTLTKIWWYCIRLEISAIAELISMYFNVFNYSFQCISLQTTNIYYQAHWRLLMEYQGIERDIRCHIAAVCM